jgi:mono/diheme cytochrome c family protein
MRPGPASLVGAAAAFALAAPASAQDATVARGKQVFDLWCYACHKPLNPGDAPVAGTSSLQRNYQGAKPAALEQRTDLAPDYVRFIVRHGVKSMPFTRRTEVSDPDLDALVAYLTRTKR